VGGRGKPEKEMAASSPRRRRLAYRHALLERDVQPRLSIFVAHRSLTHRSFPLPPTPLPSYAERELLGVRDRQLLMQSVPRRLVPTWIEGELAEQEAVRVPLTGWELSESGLAVALDFDAARADLDTPPLLAASSNGTVQLATEIQLQFDGHPLRIWRYGVPSEAVRVHGKRTVRMLDAAERSMLVGWHACTTDGTSLLQLDTPSYGTDGLADVWHLSRMRVALNVFELYHALLPKLLGTHLGALRRQSTATEPFMTTCELQLGFYDSCAATVASARLPVVLEAGALPTTPEPRRVPVINVVATLDPRQVAGEVVIPATGWLPRNGMVSLVLRQGGRIVLRACMLYHNALGSVDAACWSLGEAQYQDVSDTTHREALLGRLSTGKVKVRRTRCSSSSKPLGDAEIEDEALTAESQGRGGEEEAASLEWCLAGFHLSMLIPGEDVPPGVQFRAHACEAEWVAQLRSALRPR